MKKRINLAIRLLVVLPFLAILAVPRGQARQKAEPQSPPGDKGSAQTRPTATVDAAYVIAPQDVLDIDVWKEPEITRTVPVRPDGKISLPLLNDVQAAGLTAAKLSEVITGRLKTYLSNPQVTVIVTTVNSQRIYILGEVNHGGVLPLLPNMTVLQALSSAGGFTGFAHPKKIYVLRNENGKQIKYPFDYKKAMNGEQLDQDIVLKPGDTIVVP